MTGQSGSITLTSGQVGTGLDAGLAAIDLTLAKVAMAKVFVAPTAPAVETAEYQLTVSNVGRTNDNGTITVTDPIPTGLAGPVSASGPGWDCTATTATALSCTYAAATPTLAAGASLAPITLRANVVGPAGTTISNTATVKTTSTEFEFANNVGRADTPVRPAYAKVSGWVWKDDGDGKQSPTEPGISGITITLFDGSGNVAAVTTTDLDGRYTFSDLLPAWPGYGDGVYRVGFARPPGLSPSPRTVGDDKLDSDMRSEDYTTGPLPPLSPGEHRRFVDAGFYQGGIIILTPPAAGATIGATTSTTTEATTAEATSGTSPVLALDSPTTTLFTPQQLAQIPPAPEPDPFARVSANGEGQPDDTAELALTGANTRRISQFAFAALLLGLGLVLFPRRRSKR